jgi:argininosuccinate lyase
MRGTKLWGMGSGEGLLPELERFSSSLEVDFELYPYDVAGSVAHARGLAASGVLSSAQLTAIVRGLRRIKRELDGNTFVFLDTD